MPFRVVAKHNRSLTQSPHCSRRGAGKATTCAAMYPNRYSPPPPPPPLPLPLPPPSPHSLSPLPLPFPVFLITSHMLHLVTSILFVELPSAIHAIATSLLADRTNNNTAFMTSPRAAAVISDLRKRASEQRTDASPAETQAREPDCK